jgi:hypothetical protein
VNKRVIVAGDFNAKSACWGGEITDKRGGVLMEALCDYVVFSLRLNHRYTFYRNGRTSCPNNQCYERTKRSVWREQGSE